MSYDDWVDLAAKGWVHATHGRESEAVAAWQAADAGAAEGGQPETRINPELSLLRFMPDRGRATGVVGSPLPNEDYVVSMKFLDWPEESETAEGMYPIEFINQDMIKHYIDYHTIPRMRLMDNTTEEQPHLMVLSTGRCGTVSLAKLMEQTQYLTYHNCIFNVAAATKFEMMAQLAGYHETYNAEMPWAATRAAEWIGAVKLGRPAAFLSHLDTIFAPVFAKLHPQSRFIYLHRDPVKIFTSFYTKNQWNDSQLQAIHYDFPFRWQRDNLPLVKALAWYIKFTETFSRAFGAVMGDRFIEISADELFVMDEDELWKLWNFTDMDISKYDLKEHFMRPHNAKAHKAVVPIDQSILEEFLHEYDAL